MFAAAKLFKFAYLPVAYIVYCLVNNSVESESANIYKKIILIKILKLFLVFIKTKDTFLNNTIVVKASDLFIF